MRRRRLVVLLGVALVFAAWGTARGVDSWRYRASLEQAKARIASGSPAEARRLLAESAARWPGEGEAEVPARGLRASPRSPRRRRGGLVAGAAIVALRRPRGHAPRPAAAEARPVRRGRGTAPHRPSGPRASTPSKRARRWSCLLKLEGRFDELRTVVQDGWDSYPDRFGLLRQLANLDSIVPVPIEKIWPALEKAAENSPDDDRIWLGRANLAIRTGEFAKARRWLDDCLQTTPATTHRSGRAGWTWPWRRATWPGRGRLSSIFRPTASRRKRSSPCEPGSPRDPATSERERQALEKLLELAPGRVQAVERLAELELLAGRPESAARLRARKAELDRAKIHYEMLVTKPSAEAVRHSAEMARLAEVLGRSFEARSLWSVVLERSPERSGGPRGPVATGTSQGGPRRADARRPPRRARPGSSPGQPIARAPLGPATQPSPTTPRPAGLRFTFENGATPARQIPETMSGGVGLLDYDGDGWLDVYLVQGGPFPPRQPSTGPGR